MRKSIFKLLIGLLSLAAAWNFGHLSGAMQRETQRQQALSAAIGDMEETARALQNELSVYRSDTSLAQALRQRGFISKGDIVFFDGG